MIRVLRRTAETESVICGDLEVVKTNDFHVVRMIPVPIALATLDIEVE